MTKNYQLFIFRRDLRIRDNLGLAYAIKHFNNIIPIFIFTPEQIGKQNKYRSDNAIQFMIESLKDLNNKLKKYKSRLLLFYGDNISILNKIKKKIKLNAVIFNKDYTPYARNRDKKINKWCNKNKIKCLMCHDYLLCKIGKLNKDNGEPYSVFSPFRNKGLKAKISKPDQIHIKYLINTNKLKSIESNYPKYKINKSILVNGGRKNGLKYLRKISDFNDYSKKRNKLDYSTTLLSAYIKFGCVSIREVYWEVKNNLRGKNANTLLSQLMWREFYYYIAYYNPQVLNGKTYNDKFNNSKFKWKKDKNWLKRWCKGETGYPIVDAGMRELNKTGYMHNRARLITSNFLNRLLRIDWRIGEKYYARKLTDYDPSVNNGNWQWIASVGVDTKPFTQRLFNPILQSKKYDPDAKYIKKWLPQLKNIPANKLHNWDKYCDDYDLNKLNYYEPIVNYKEARKQSIKMYKNAK